MCFHIHNLLWLMLLSVIPNSCDSQHCHDYLISGPRGISDLYMTASSVDIETKNCTSSARIYSIDGKEHVWCPATNNESEYFQVSMYRTSTIVSVWMEGRSNGDRVTSFTISYSSDLKKWKTIKDTTSGNETIFPGNVNAVGIQKINLTSSISIKYLRINSKTWVNWPSFKLELIGCPQVNKDIHLSSKSHQWEQSPTWFSLKPLQSVWNVTQPEMWKCGRACFKSSKCSSFSYNSGTKLCSAHTVPYFVYNSAALSNEPYDPVSKTFFTKAPAEELEYKKMSPFPKPVKVHTLETSYSTALSTCNYELSTLLVINTEYQRESLWNYTRTNAVLAQRSTFLVSGKLEGNVWRHWDNSTIPSSLWSPSEPGSGECTVLTDTGLSSTNCSSSHFFICGY